MLNDEQKLILRDAQDWCDEEDKSTAFMLQYMAESLQLHDPRLDETTAHDMVVEFLTSGA